MIIENTDIYNKQKTSIASAFNKAVETYDKVAVLQKTVCNRLRERLEFIKLDPGLILDLGSGTGLGAKQLAAKYRRARIVQADLAIDMLLYSQKQGPRFFNKNLYTGLDGEKLPFAESVFDLVFSNLMLQWCDNPDAVFRGVNFALKQNSLFIFSTFGPDTLKELRESWASVDDLVHVNSFLDMHDIGDALTRAGFEQVVMETEDIRLNYNQPLDLMKDLKSLGANNKNTGRRHSLTGKSRLNRMLTAYDTHRQDGKLPATFEVIYGHAWTPDKLTSRRINETISVVPVSAIKNLADR